MNDEAARATTDNADYDRHIGENIRKLRTEREATQAQLAEAMDAAGVPWRQQIVVKVEAGQRPLRLQEAQALAKVLRVPLSEIVADELTVDPELALKRVERQAFRLYMEAETAALNLNAALKEVRKGLVWAASAGRAVNPDTIESCEWLVENHTLRDVVTRVGDAVDLEEMHAREKAEMKSQRPALPRTIRRGLRSRRDTDGAS